jgi:DNA-binding CsgD family transcriptional regulator
MAGRKAWRISGRTLVAKTCGGCKELKDASEFRRRKKDGYYQGWCNRCQHDSAKKTDLRANANSQDRATKSKQPWTTREIKELIAYMGEGLTTRQIAEKMGRSYAAITQARHKKVK